MTINEYQEKVYQEILNELRDNNIVRIYGPSGVGKTTLINRFNQEKLSFFLFQKWIRMMTVFFHWSCHRHLLETN